MKTIILIVFLMVFGGCEGGKENSTIAQDINSLSSLCDKHSQASFKLGAIYGAMALEDPRCEDCKTYRDVVDLAITMSHEEAQK